MEILRRASVPFTTLDGGAETRHYYEQAQHGYRLVDTAMSPSHEQKEHRHDQLLDITLVIEGEVRVTQRENGELHEEILGPGDMICFTPPHFHNVRNAGDTPARTVTLKLRVDPNIDPQAMAHLLDKDWIGYLDETRQGSDRG